MNATTQPNRQSRKKIYLFLSALILLQVAFISAFIPLTEWFSADAIYSDDFSFHYANTLERISFLKDFGKYGGYDPYIRAGTITSAFLPIDNNGCAIFSYILFFLPTAISFKLFYIFGALLFPFIGFRTARNFDLSINTSLIAAFLLTLLLHITFMVNFFQWGSGSFLFASCFSLLAVSCFYRFCSTEKISTLIWTTLTIAWAVWVHAFSIVILFAPMILCYVFHFKKLRWRLHGYVLTATGISILLNIPWIHPFLIFKDQMARDHSTLFYTTRSVIEPIKTYLLRNHLFNSYMNIVFQKEEWVDIILLLAGLLGIYAWYKNKNIRLAAVYFGTIVFFLILSFYGAFFEITNITPMRFLITLNMFLVIPASLAIMETYRRFFSDKSIKVRLVSLAVLAYLLAALVATPYYHLFYKKDFRLVCSLPEPFQQMVSWINNNTSNKGRILIENSDFETQHRYYGTHLPIILPQLTGREYIGNYSYYAASKDGIATFNSGILFRRPIKEFSHDELSYYFKLYNIKWIIYWSDAAHRALGRDNPFIKPLVQIDGFNICSVEREPSFFIKGNGNAQADYNEIRLTDVKAVDGEIILCYHWMKFLKTDPPRTIERVLLAEDELGFIKIKDPPQTLLIYNDF